MRFGSGEGAARPCGGGVDWGDGGNTPGARGEQMRVGARRGFGGEIGSPMMRMVPRPVIRLVAGSVSGRFTIGARLLGFRMRGAPGAG